MLVLLYKWQKTSQLPAISLLKCAIQASSLKSHAVTKVRIKRVINSHFKSPGSTAYYLWSIMLSVVSPKEFSKTISSGYF